VSSNVSEFRLSPQEDWIFGVKLRRSTLSFGPSGSEVALATVACGLMIFIGAVMAAATASMHRQFSEAELEQRHLIREQGLSPGESADLIREALGSGTLRHSITLAVHNAPRYASERAAVVP